VRAIAKVDLPVPGRSAINTEGISEGETILSLGEIGVLSFCFFGAIAEDYFVVEFVTDRFGGVFIWIGTADGRTARFLNPDFKNGL